MALSEAEAKLGSVYFDYDKFAITSAMKTKLASNSEAVKMVTDTYTVRVEGNCDEWGSDEYNFALGLKRAYAVKKALMAEGTDASKISMVSYGESNPVCANKTQECWAKNRRVDFSLLP
jgi:peptidoglycan-associated lipoprotein